MEKITEKFTRFVTDVTWDALPENVVHEVKRLLLDSVGCAVLGLSTDKAKLAVELTRRLGGAPESSILGLGARVSPANAAFANAEMANALDYDASLNGHGPPIVVPAALAVAEARGASGRDFIVGLAVGLEGAARMMHAFSRAMELVREGPDRGKVLKRPAGGYGATIFGAAAAATRVLGLDLERTLNAMGIAGYIAPVPCHVKFLNNPHAPMAKYCMTGWVSQAAVTAALLAELGYTGDQSVLDGDYGFWRYYLPYKWLPEVLLDGIGREWYIPKTYYKPYPCCREWHTMLDCFTHIIETHRLAPQDIEAVRLFGREESFAQPVWSNRDIRSQSDAQMSAPYNIAVAAYRTKHVDWQDFASINDPGIRAFMGKISLEPYAESSKIALEVPGSDPAAVEVFSKGRVFREERKFSRGGGRSNTWGTRFSLPDNILLTDEELIRKFKDNVSRVLPQNKADRFVEAVMGLEEAPSVAEVVKHARL